MLGLKNIMIRNFLKKIFFRKPKIVVILGQTATGKTNLAIEIAQRYSGEIISADSRQVYKKLDIGTAKVRPEEMKSIPHYMIDVADVSERYTVAEFARQGKQRIHEILNRKKLPIICGGTGMYIDALVYQQFFPAVTPNTSLRNELEKYSTEDLFVRLKKLDAQRANSIDPHNKVRLVRAIEIAEVLGSVPQASKKLNFDVLYIGLTIPKEELSERIDQRIHMRLANGMLEETKDLLRHGIGHSRLQELGLEYRYMSLYLQGNLSHEEMVSELSRESRKFAKRQQTWFKRNKKIHWFHPELDTSLIFELTENFISK